MSTSHDSWIKLVVNDEAQPQNHVSLLLIEDYIDITKKNSNTLNTEEINDNNHSETTEEEYHIDNKPFIINHDNNLFDLSILHINDFTSTHSGSSSPTQLTGNVFFDEYLKKTEMNKLLEVLDDIKLTSIVEHFENYTLNTCTTPSNEPTTVPVYDTHNERIPPLPPTAAYNNKYINEMNLDNYIESYLAPYLYDNTNNYTLNYTNIKEDIYTIINDIYTSLITLFQPYYITLCDTMHNILSSTYITDLTHLTQNLPKINTELLYTSKCQHRIFLLFASFIVLSSLVLLPVRYHIYSTQPSLRTATGNTITTSNVHHTVTAHNSNPSLLNKLLMSRDRTTTSATTRMPKTHSSTPSDLFIDSDDDTHTTSTAAYTGTGGTARLTSPSTTTTTATVDKQEASEAKAEGMRKDTDRVMSEGQQQQEFQGLVSLYSRLTSVLLLLAKRNTSQPMTAATTSTTTVSVKKECDKDKNGGAGSTDKSTSYTTTNPATTTTTPRSNTTVKSSSFTTVVSSYLPLSNGLSYVDFIHRLKKQASAGGAHMKIKEANALVFYGPSSSSSGAAKF